MTTRDIQKRIAIEKRIVGKVVDGLLAAGYGLGVYDSGEVTLANSTDRKQVMAALFTTDDEYLLAYKNGERNGWVRFVYGNAGWDVISDYTTNLDNAMADANALAQKIGDEL